MSNLVYLSLFLNVAVLVPVCAGLLLDARWAQSVFGPRSPARGILLSIYFAIMLLSAALIVPDRVAYVVPLLLVQIVYKVTTPFTVGSIRNPVVLSNLAIAAFHALTLWSIQSEIIR